MAGLKPYPVYENSDVPWLQHLPAGWSILRGKNVFNVVDVRSETGEEELLTVSSSDGVVPRSQKTVTMFKAESYVGHKLCWPGDLVINSLWAWMQGLGFSKYHGLVSSAYGVYRPKPRLAPQWLFFNYLLRSAAYKWQLQTRSKGVWLSRLELSDPAFLDMPIIVPPPEDAAAVVLFLDHVDRRVRRYIAARKKLIALLNEQKQALIQRAVTRGLDSTVHLKPSGVEWLGEIPGHWGVTRLRSIVASVTSGSRGWSDYAADEGPLFLRIGSLTRDSIELDLSDSVHLNLPATSEAKRSRVRGGDVILSITAYIGSVAVAPPDIAEAYVSQHLALCRPRDQRHNSRWLGYVLLSSVGRKHGRTRLYGGTKDGLSLDDVRDYPLLLPPRPEQDAMVATLDASLAQLGKITSGVRHHIDLIREYRTRLIADVVTGKLDVREAAARLPEEGEESDREVVAMDEDDGEDQGPESLEDEEQRDGG